MVSSDPPDIDPASVYGRAIELHAAGELDAAAALYGDMLRRDSRDLRALAKMGLVRLQQNRLDEAVEHLERALAADPSALEPLLWRGEIHRRRGALAPAIAAFRAALAIDPNLAPALFNLALAEKESGNPDAAHDLWARFSELRLVDKRVCREIGHLSVERGDLDDAAAWYARQLERTPDDADVICDLAGVLLATKAYVATGAVLAPLIARSPGHERARQLLDEAMRGRADRDTAP